MSSQSLRPRPFAPCPSHDRRGGEPIRSSTMSGPFALHVVGLGGEANLDEIPESGFVANAIPTGDGSPRVSARRAHWGIEPGPSPPSRSWDRGPSAWRPPSGRESVRPDGRRRMEAFHMATFFPPRYWRSGSRYRGAPLEGERAPKEKRRQIVAPEGVMHVGRGYPHPFAGFLPARSTAAAGEATIDPRKRS